MTAPPPPPPPPFAPDWGLGRYELTAAQLLPAAEVLVAHAGIAAGERVVDVGCGTGNAALLAAARGARVTGVDPARRLLEVARATAADRGLDATFVSGEAAAIPLEDGAADAVLSSFAVIFAPDAVSAAAEMARVTAPHGRIVLSAWLPEGPFFEMARVIRQAVAEATAAASAAGSSAGPSPGAGARPFAWHDREALAGLLGLHGFRVETTQDQVAFTAESARTYIDREFNDHPSTASLAAVVPRVADDLRAKALALLEAGNEDPGAFRVTSRYVVAIARRG